MLIHTCTQANYNLFLGRTIYFIQFNCNNLLFSDFFWTWSWERWKRTSRERGRERERERVGESEGERERERASEGEREWERDRERERATGSEGVRRSADRPFLSSFCLYFRRVVCAIMARLLPRSASGPVVVTTGLRDDGWCARRQQQQGPQQECPRRTPPRDVLNTRSFLRRFISIV